MIRRTVTAASVAVLACISLSHEAKAANVPVSFSSIDSISGSSISGSGTFIPVEATGQIGGGLAFNGYGFVTLTAKSIDGTTVTISNQYVTATAANSSSVLGTNFTAFYDNIGFRRVNLGLYQDNTSFLSIFDVCQAEVCVSGRGDSTIVSVGTISTVPLPSSAPMLGLALLSLGALGYGMKRQGMRHS